MNKPIAYYCNCGTGGHQNGCSLHLRLLIKYGSEKQGIVGLSKLRGCINTVPEKVEKEIDYWWKQLLPEWISKNKKTLKSSEVLWS